MKKQSFNHLIILAFAFCFCVKLYAQPPKVPGLIIDHIPASTQTYIGSPSICILPNGHYIASHDFFGTGSTANQQGVTLIFSSEDKGESWNKIAEIKGQLWSTLFVNRDVLYILGTYKQDGNLVIRKSLDNGKTWSKPTDDETGLLRSGHFHTAPVPVTLINGRLWRDVEIVKPGHPKGSPYLASVISASVNSDLLKASSWEMTNPLSSDSIYLNNTFKAWLEGNVVETADGQVIDILRVSTTENGADKAAVLNVSRNGDSISFNSSSGFIDFAGGARKFTIRYDTNTKRYWTICNFILPEYSELNAGSVRNTLVIKSSDDLFNWKIHKILLHHQDVEKHGFQYVDWQFDGKDIIFASRTAFDDGQDGAENFHNANYLTFHLVKNYRKLSKENKKNFNVK